MPRWHNEPSRSLTFAPTTNNLACEVRVFVVSLHFEEQNILCNANACSLDYEASFLRLLEKVTNGCRIRINETGTEVHYVPGFVSGGAGLKHDCPPSRGIGKSQAKKELKTCGEKLVRACA